MKEFLLSIFIGIQALLGFGGEPAEPQVGATVFKSQQLAAGADNGEVLSTDGTNNVWIAAGTGDITGGASLGTGLNIFDSKSGANLLFNSLEAGTNITLSTTTNSNTIVINSTASGGGSGNVSTSTGETAGNLAYWTSTNATPALLGKVATSAPTFSSPLTTSGTAGYLVGGSGFTIGLDTSGTWSGNAGTASALAANGTNCSAGSLAAGVDASGNSEGCTDVWTEAENTSAAYISLSSLSASYPLAYNSGTGAFTFNGLSTTTDSGLSQGFLYVGSGGILQTAASSTALASKQDVLVSGTNIKTINGSSILGSGNLTVTGGSGLASSTPWTLGSLVVAKDDGSVTTIATSTLKTSELTNDAGFITSAENPLTFNWPLVRNTNTISFSGLSTTTNLIIGHIPFVSGVNTLSSRATTSVSCSGSVSCSSFDVLGSSPVTITGTDSTASSTLLSDTNSWSAENYFGSNIFFTNGSEFAIDGQGGGTITYYSTDFNTAYTSLGSTAAGQLDITYQDGNTNPVGTLSLSSLTGNRTYTFPDKNITLAGINNETFTGLTSMSYSSSTIYSSFITASTTNLNIGGDSFIDLTGTGLAVSGGVLNTSNIPNASLANSTISGIALGSNLANLSATDSTLTFSGTYNGGTARTIGLNLGNANTWTALQTFAHSSTTGQSTFANASTSVLTVDNSINLFGGGAKTTANALCIQLTGSAGLCDGSDDGAGGGLTSYDAWTHPAAGQSATTSLVLLYGQASSTLFSANTGYFDFINATSTTATSTFTNAVQIGGTAGDNALKLSAGRVYPASNSVGGMLNLSNGTTNTGPALVAYTNVTTSSGNLANFRCDNSSMAHDCVKIDYDGTGDGLAIAATAAASNALSLSNTGVDHTLNVAYTGSTAQKGALNLTSTNSGGSVFQITGNPTGLGVGKITHNSTGDADSSILSLAASDTGYLGQGLFIDMESVASTQKILNLRADTNERLTLQAGGNLGISSSTPSGARLSVNSVAGDAFSLWVGSTTAPWLMVSNSGFGTTTLSGLTVAGSATSTSNVGFNITTGCYAIGGICIGGGGGSGDITSVGDVASGAAFDGTQGTTLTFYNAGGNATLSYDGTFLSANSAGLTLNGLSITDTEQTTTQNLYSFTAAGAVGDPFMALADNDVEIGLTTNYGVPYLAVNDVGIQMGTTTSALSMVTIASSTKPQLSLSDGAGISQWTMRNAGGKLYFATTTVAGTATSSIAALTIDNNGKLVVPALAQGYTFAGSNGILETVSTSTLAGQVFPFTSQTNYNSTSTALGLLNGFFSTASSTISSALQLPSLTQGIAYIGSGGLVQTRATTTASCSGGISCTSFDIFGSSPVTISSFTYPFPSAATSTLLTLSGGFNASGGTATLGTIAGAIDGGGATSFEIPNGTGPTVDAVGEIAFDTTDNQLVVGTSTASMTVALPLKQKLWSGTIASTSVDFISGGRIPLNSWSDGVIITEIRCAVDAGTSKTINLDTLAGGANTDSVTCATTETSDTAMSANYNIAAGTLMAIEMGATTGSVDYVTFSVWGYVKRE